MCESVIVCVSVAVCVCVCGCVCVSLCLYVSVYVCECGKSKGGCIDGFHTSVERVVTGHMRSGAAPEAGEVRAVGPAYKSPTL